MLGWWLVAGEADLERDYAVGLLLAYGTFLLGAGEAAFAPEHAYDPDADDGTQQQQQQQQGEGVRMDGVHAIGLGRLGEALLDHRDAVHAALAAAAEEGGEGSGSKL